MPNWVLYNRSEDGYWNNEWGWMGLDEAERYTDEDVRTMATTAGAEWVDVSTIPTLSNLIEQLRDVYMGRETYDSDEEWLANLDACFEQLSNHPETAFEFNPQARI